MIGAILKDATAPIIVSSGPPAALDHIVATCLAKDPDEPRQSSADVARESKWIADMPRNTTRRGGPDDPMSGFCPQQSARSRERTVAVMGWSTWQPTAAGEVIRFPVDPPGDLRFIGSTSSISILEFADSPDGRQLSSWRDVPANRRCSENVE